MSSAYHRTTARAAWIGVWLLLAGLLCLWAWPRQIERGCWLAEWPFEQGCADYPSQRLDATTPAQQLRHLERNIGDGRTYLFLTDKLAKQNPALAAPLLPWLAQLVPHDNQALALQTNAALARRDYKAAIKGLVLLVQRGEGSARAPLALLMLAPETQALVRAELTADSRWLDPVLQSLAAQVPAEQLLPFVTDGWTLGVLPLPTVLGFIERLQATGHWLDAYTLWVQALGQVQDGLYNPGFDRPASQRGFDWRWPQQAEGKVGVRVAQVSAAPRAGSMLLVDMNGRAALPQALVSQPLVLLGGPYRLTGRYLAERMRSREGLVWALRCAKGGERFAQTAPLMDTQKDWAEFTLDFAPPVQCEGAVRLQLETTAAWEARAGMSGVVYFDDLALKAVPTGGTSASQ